MPAARSRLWGWLRAVIIRHRLLAGCARANLVTAGGKWPLIVSVTPTAYGERAWLWCRAPTPPAGVAGLR
ncbi:hypothetical protein [Nonomuraea sp. NPDC049400]|uniref:hypothetical protein n=1 Tax=Nonomuraea sp. NPDC049400 TaxID=3364352 RepID=UPI0037B7FD15